MTLPLPFRVDHDEIQANFDILAAHLPVGAEGLGAVIAQQLGLSTVGPVGSTVRGGSISIPGAESVTNTTYTTLATADQITAVVLPTMGIIEVLYQALFKSSVAGAGSAALFLNNTQVVIQDAPNRAAIGQATTTNGTFYNPVATFGAGLTSSTATASDHTSDLTTGQIIGVNPTATSFYGGSCQMFAAAGTYNVSVRFKSTSGSMTAKERKLWVFTRSR